MLIGREGTRGLGMWQTAVGSPRMSCGIYARILSGPVAGKVHVNWQRNSTPNTSPPYLDQRQPKATIYHQLGSGSPAKLVRGQTICPQCGGAGAGQPTASCMLCHVPGSATNVVVNQARVMWSIGCGKIRSTTINTPVTTTKNYTPQGDKRQQQCHMEVCRSRSPSCAACCTAPMTDALLCSKSSHRPAPRQESTRGCQVKHTVGDEGTAEILHGESDGRARASRELLVVPLQQRYHERRGPVETIPSCHWANPKDGPDPAIRRSPHETGDTHTSTRVAAGRAAQQHASRAWFCWLTRHHGGNHLVVSDGGAKRFSPAHRP